MVQRLKEEDGYTIVEMLIAITIVSIVLGVASTVFVFASSRLNRWSESSEFYSTTQIVQSQIYKDVLKAEVVTVTDSTMILVRDGKEKVYNWNDGALKKNQTHFVKETTDSLYLIPGHSKEGIIEWELIHKTEERELMIKQILSARRPIYWKPIRAIN